MMSSKFSKKAPVKKPPAICSGGGIIPPLLPPYCPNYLYCDVHYLDTSLGYQIHYDDFLPLTYSVPCDAWRWQDSIVLPIHTLWLTASIFTPTFPAIAQLRFTSWSDLYGTRVSHDYINPPPNNEHPFKYETEPLSIPLGVGSIEWWITVADLAQPEYPS